MTLLFKTGLARGSKPRLLIREPAMKPILAACLLACSGLALAQPGMPSPKVAQEKIGALSMMIGDWKGSGWTVLPDGSKAEFLSSETVTKDLAGTVLIVRGKHFSKAAPAVPVHDALGIIGWDARGQQLRMRSWLATGLSGDYPLTATADGFTWTIPTPQMTIRYEAQHLKRMSRLNQRQAATSQSEQRSI